MSCRNCKNAEIVSAQNRKISKPRFFSSWKYWISEYFFIILSWDIRYLTYSSYSYLNIFVKINPDIFLILIWEFLSSSLDIFIKLSDLDALCNLSECFFIQIFENFKVLGTLLYLRKALWNATRTGTNLPYVRLSCQFNRFRCTVLYNSRGMKHILYCAVLSCQNCRFLRWLCWMKAFW